ncbi:unnamed protein product [Pseudo-nitzschia multistriata]|uniref:Radical SAM core domain-containing protein n=1 Tax=Pseudo-nitzschia multistriata TaxID=183589 RepID=A0A448Z5E9_9STRA|nr:unnamed protein product [Pseudo-nitzschia multistriata]
MQQSPFRCILCIAFCHSFWSSVVLGWAPAVSSTFSRNTLSRERYNAREPVVSVARKNLRVASKIMLSATIAGDDILPLGDKGSAGQAERTRNDVLDDDTTTASSPAATPISSLLSYSFEELTDLLGGSGKAKACWDCLRMGIDPIWYYGNQRDDDESNTERTGSDLLKGWTRGMVEERLAATSTRGTPTKLGKSTLDLLEQIGGSKVEEDVCKLSQVSVSPDGTTKLLLQLASDGLEVETVIIPWEDRGKSTLCVSSQVGCRQGCTFCSTGRMGKLRNLSTAEIAAQMYWANKVYRLSSLPENQEQSTSNNNSKKLYPIDNCVFMGMGEPADNAPSVVKTASMMADNNLFQLAPRKITISTVAPSPEVFRELAEAPAVLAWSVHCSRDEIRRQLVPTTRHSMEELRDGLMDVLRGRTKRLRNTMLEVTLLDGINDSEEDARHLADFCRPFFEGPTAIRGIKLTVNLIPWNDISASFGPASGYRPPKPERIRAYQKILGENGILCYVRTTRGDEENAACGMLSTKKRQKEGKQQH